MVADFRAFVPLFVLSAAGCVTRSNYLEDRAKVECEIMSVCNPDHECRSAEEIDRGDCSRLRTSRADECLAALEESLSTLKAQDAHYAGECEDLIGVLDTQGDCASVWQGRRRRACRDNGDAGRPILDRGQPVLAAIVRGHCWSHVGADRRVDSSSAAARLRAARVEHASVAAFSRLSLELLGLGAPPSIVSACHLAALDEIEHARICLGEARRRGAGDVDFGPFPSLAARRITLREVAVEALREGCVGEGAAAIDAQVRATGAEPHLATALRRIARDELAHAQLAWATVGWAISRDSSIAGALLREASQLRDELSAHRNAAQVHRLYCNRSTEFDAARYQQIARDVVEQIVVPTLAQLQETHMAANFS